MSLLVKARELLEKTFKLTAAKATTIMSAAPIVFVFLVIAVLSAAFRQSDVNPVAYAVPKLLDATIELIMTIAFIMADVSFCRFLDTFKAEGRDVDPVARTEFLATTGIAVSVFLIGSVIVGFYNITDISEIGIAAVKAVTTVVLVIALLELTKTIIEKDIRFNRPLKENLALLMGNTKLMIAVILLPFLVVIRLMVSYITNLLINV